MGLLLLSEEEEVEEESLPDEEFIVKDFKLKIFNFLHKPIRVEDKKNNDFIKRFLDGPQSIWDNNLAPKIDELIDLIDPAKCPTEALQYLKSIVGFTSELDNITKDLSEIELRKIISFAVPLWKQKGLDVGYINIIRFLTGVTARLYDWFDFKMLIGVAALGNEFLEDDAWLISSVGIESTTPINNIIGLWTFEHNIDDTSINRNHGEIIGEFSFSEFTALSSSNYSINLDGGYLKILNSSVYDFSNDFTIEMFVATNVTQDNILFFKMDSSGKGIEIRYDSGTNDIVWTIDDSANSATDTYATGLDLDDLTYRHIALTINKTSNFGRIWIDGNGGAKIDISSVLDITNSINILTSNDVFGERFNGYIDNFRIATDAIYDVDSATITVPAIPFIEYQQGQLDEYRTDIRLMDDGSINRILLKRILNIMRPLSERLNLIYVTFYTDFTLGKEEFDTISGSSVVEDNELKIGINTIEQYSLDSSNFSNIVLQIKLKATNHGIYGIRFAIQDNDNYYVVEVNTNTKMIELYKVVATVKSSIGGPVFQDIFLDVFYFLTIVTYYDNVNINTKIKCYLDMNLLIDIIDDTFNNGTFAMQTDLTSKISIDNIELFVHPLDIETIEPGFE